MRIESRNSENSRTLPKFVPTKEEMEESRRRVYELTRQSFFETLETVSKVNSVDTKEKKE